MAGKAAKKRIKNNNIDGIYGEANLLSIGDSFFSSARLLVYALDKCLAGGDIGGKIMVLWISYMPVKWYIFVLVEVDISGIYIREFSGIFCL